MTRTVKPLKGRTFKCFPAVIELRAYIPNNIKIEGKGGLFDRDDDENELRWMIAMEMAAGLVGDNSLPLARRICPDLTIASNRAGLHLAYLHPPEDGSNRGSSCLVENANCGYEQAIGRLKKAGWKECKGA